MGTRNRSSAVTASTTEPGEHTALRVQPLLDIAKDCNSFEQFEEKMSKNKRRFPVIHATAPVQMLEPELKTVPNVFSFTNQAGNNVNLELVITGSLKIKYKNPDEGVDEYFRCRFLLREKKRIYGDIQLDVCEMTDGSEIALIHGIKVEKAKVGMATKLMDELEKECPRFIYKPPFSKQGLGFVLHREGFANLEDFWSWSKTQPYEPRLQSRYSKEMKDWMRDIGDKEQASDSNLE